MKDRMVVSTWVLQTLLNINWVNCTELGTEQDGMCVTACRAYKGRRVQVALLQCFCWSSAYIVAILLVELGMHCNPRSLMCCIKYRYIIYYATCIILLITTLSVANNASHCLVEPYS